MATKNTRNYLIEAGNRLVGETLNCKYFIQRITGVPKLDELPSKPFRSAQELSEGDVLKWHGGIHWAVYLGDGEIMEVEEWGATPRIVSLSEMLQSEDPPETVFQAHGWLNVPKKKKKKSFFRH